MTDIPTDESIETYLHCGKCLDERPAGISPRDWQRVSVGLTACGLQIWCNRHECNVAHIDFEGHKHPAEVSAKAALEWKH